MGMRTRRFTVRNGLTLLADESGPESGLRHNAGRDSHREPLGTGALMGLYELCFGRDWVGALPCVRLS